MSDLDASRIEAGTKAQRACARDAAMSWSSLLGHADRSSMVNSVRAGCLNSRSDGDREPRLECSLKGLQTRTHRMRVTSNTTAIQSFGGIRRVSMRPQWASMRVHGTLQAHSSLCSRQQSPHHPQIAQGENHRQSHAVVGQPSTAHLGIPNLLLMTRNECSTFARMLALSFSAFSSH